MSAIERVFSLEMEFIFRFYYCLASMVSTLLCVFKSTYASNGVLAVGTSRFKHCSCDITEESVMLCKSISQAKRTFRFQFLLLLV